jgi:hypothetical protein
MKDLRNFANTSIIVHGDDIVGCLIDSEIDKSSTLKPLSTTLPKIAISL